MPPALLAAAIALRYFDEHYPTFFDRLPDGVYARLENDLAERLRPVVEDGARANLLGRVTNKAGVPQEGEKKS